MFRTLEMRTGQAERLKAAAPQLVGLLAAICLEADSFLLLLPYYCLSLS